MFTYYLLCLCVVTAPSPIGINIFERLKNVPNIEVNALAALHTLVDPKSCKYEDVSVTGLPHDRTFVVRLSLDSGMTFDGVG